MVPNYRKTEGCISLTACRTEKFKLGMLTVCSVFPIQREDAYLTSLLFSVLHRGTEKYPTQRELNRRSDYLFGTEFESRNYFFGDCQVVGFSVDYLNRRYLPEGESVLSGALEILSQLLFHPCLDGSGNLLAKYVESEKKNQCDAIRATMNNPASYAMKRSNELFFDGLPAGIPILGTVEEVMAVTPERLTAHWKKLIGGFSLECFYVGEEDGEELFDCIRREFADQLICKEKKQTKSPLSLVPERPSRSICETFPAEQSQLRMFLRSGTLLTDKEVNAAKVYNEILGGSPSSKLFLNVREKNSLCYVCSSAYSSEHGSIAIRCGLKREKREQAEAEILRQIREIREGHFTAEELETAKKALVNAYRSADDSAQTVARICFHRAISGDLSTMEDSVRGILSVTAEDVTAFASTVTVALTYFLEGNKSAGKEENDEED